MRLVRQILLTLFLDIAFLCHGQTFPPTLGGGEICLNDSIIKAKKISRLTLDHYEVVKKDDGSIKRYHQDKSDILFDTAGKPQFQLLYKIGGKRFKTIDTVFLNEPDDIIPDSVFFNENKTVETKIFKEIHNLTRTQYDDQKRIVQVYSHDIGEWDWTFTPNYSLTFYSYDNKSRIVRQVIKRGTYYDRDTTNLYWHEETLFTYDAINLLQTQQIVFKSNIPQVLKSCPITVKYEYTNNVPSKVIPVMDKCLSGGGETIITLPDKLKKGASR